MRPPAPIESFHRAFPGRRSVHLARAPGRVNLIGEHTDYNGLPVFPMALQREVRIAFAPRTDRTVRMESSEAGYGPRALVLSPAIAPFGPGDWGNYVAAAAEMLVRRYGIERGADLLVEGDIPAAAGLSSSSALVVAAALALLTVNEVASDRAELMELCAAGERYVGTRSGGMDQAICLGGRAGHAVVIDFEPLRLVHVPVPEHWRFVVADTGVRAEKSGAAMAAYNARTRECAEALATFRSHPRGRELPGSWSGLAGGAERDTALAIAAAALPDPLAGRFRHVLTEAARVRAAERAMLADDLAAFGQLMDASHASLRDDYEVSSAELDELVLLARSAGAAGARLTGAGFGGCIVALCEGDAAEHLLGELRGRWLLPRGLGTDRAFVCVPSDGASVLPLG